jgi:hypothetical protein
MASFEKNGPQERRPGLFIFAVLLLLLAAVGFFVGSHNYLIRSFSVLAVMVSVFLVRTSNFHTRPTSSVATAQETDFNVTKGPGRLAWVLSVALVPILAISFLCLQNDALHGAQTAWPVYLFTAVIVACIFVWGYLVSQLMSGR